VNHFPPSPPGRKSPTVFCPSFLGSEFQKYPLLRPSCSPLFFFPQIWFSPHGIPLRGSVLFLYLNPFGLLPANRGISMNCFLLGPSDEKFSILRFQQPDGIEVTRVYSILFSFLLLFFVFLTFPPVNFCEARIMASGGKSSPSIPYAVLPNDNPSTLKY